MSGKHNYLYRIDAIKPQGVLAKALTNLIESGTLNAIDLAVAKNELNKLNILTEKRLLRYSTQIVRRRKRLEEELEQLEALRSAAAANGWSFNENNPDNKR